MKLKENLPAILFAFVPFLLLVAAILLSFIVPAVGYRPLKSFDVAEAVHYYGPLKQHTFSEEEAARIEQLVQGLVVYGEKKDTEPMDGYSGYYLLTDAKGRTNKVEIVIGGGEEGLIHWVTINGVSYNCDLEQIRPLDELLSATWQKYFCPTIE